MNMSLDLPTVELWPKPYKHTGACIYFYIISFLNVLHHVPLMRHICEEFGGDKRLFYIDNNNIS